MTTDCWEVDRDYGGDDIFSTYVWSACECAHLCALTPNCVRGTYFHPTTPGTKSICFAKRTATSPSEHFADKTTVYPFCGKEDYLSLWPGLNIFSYTTGKKSYSYLVSFYPFYQVASKTTTTIMDQTSSNIST